MPQIVIRGIVVDFPKQPYESQVRYMDKVIEALETGKNAMLESPTGTGKTLCLLCATLAWQQHRKEKFKAKKDITVGMGLAASIQANMGTNNPGVGTSRDSTVPVIVYASRTHSQLAQVVDELRASSYRPRMTVLGSREQLCIHEKISKLKGALINHSCNALNSRRACMYKNNLENMLDQGGSFNSGETTNDVTDIEDLVKLGQKRRSCAYFYSRETSTNAEIVFMPYNYLMDGTIRRTLKIAWDNAIVVFDEAHNLERVASDAASFAFSSADIAACIEETKQVVSILRDQHVVQEATKDVKDSIFGAVAETGTQRPTLAMAASILSALFELEKRLDNIKLVTPYGGTQPPSVVLSGSALIDLVRQSGFSHEMFIEEVKKCANMLMEEAEAALAGGDAVLGGAAPMHGTEPKLNLFSSVLERIFRSSRADSNEYKAYICEEKEKPKSVTGNDQYGRTYQNNASKAVVTKRIINYWCFSTGVALKELVALGIRSVVITSGTLSPMEAMKEDMRIPFPIELQNPHVIGDNQIMVAALATGSRGKTLNSSYNNRDSADYKDEIGHTILSIYRTMGNSEMRVKQERLEGTVKGGILVFFPAYAAMDNTIERWKQCGLFDSLKSEIGSIIVEPRGNAKVVTEVSSKHANVARGGTSSSSFMLASSGGNAAARSRTADPEEEGIAGVVDEFNNAIDKFGSCLLLAVCRGKVSEGIDFSNNKGRVVIVTGIPFAPYLDPWVVLKKQYLDEKTSAKTLLSTAVPASSMTSAVSTSLQQSVVAPNAQPLYPSAPGGVVNAWQKAKQVSTVNPGVYPPPPPTLAVAPVTTVVGSKPVGKGSLTGQMWYNQSASRAVNQCLGRVIRHKNDWGAIYLLDERFLQDAQISQLSSWMRTRVKKFKSFNDSALPLTNFLMTICRDPVLRFTPVDHAKVAAASNALIKSKSMSKMNDDADEAIRRFIEISEMDLSKGKTGGEDGHTYIDKDMLSTQSVTVMAAPASTRGIVSREVLNDTVPLYTTHQEKKDPTDLRSIIGMMKKKETASSTVFSAFPSKPFASSGNSVVLDSSKFPSTQSTATNSSGGVGLVKASKPSFGLQSSKGDSFAMIDLTQPLHQQSSALTQDLLPSTQEAPSSSSSSSSTLRKLPIPVKTEETRSTSQEDVIKDIINKLKAHLTFLGMKQFKDLIIDVKDIGGLKLISQIKKFQTDLAKILLPLPDQIKLQIASDLVCLMTDRNARQAYSDMVKQHFPPTGQKRKADESTEDSATSMATQPLVTASQRSTSSLAYMKDVVAEDDVENVGSKRAKLLIQKSLQASSSSNNVGVMNKLAQIKQEGNKSLAEENTQGSFSTQKDNFLSKLKEISAFQGLKAPGTSNANNIHQNSSSALLKCIICKEQANNACAARCGHICCQTCWTHWLKVKSACPLCRQPTTMDSITKIRIKS